MHDRNRLATAPDSPAQARSWKRILSEAVRDPDELVDLLRLPERFRAAARRASELFPLVVPRGFLARMRPADPEDPLLRQVLPLDVEGRQVEGFRRDPVGDLSSSRAPGLLQKYPGRALLVAAATCAVNCRYCFRRHFPYGEMPRGIEAWEPAFRAIAEDASLREVILSGGDPLVLPDPLLSRLVAELERIPHLSRLRIHTRLPIVIPERVDARLIAWLRRSRLTPWVVVHANHPREIERTCAGALGRLVDQGVPVLNQSVLLRGVNDSTDVLVELSERLADVRVRPYYLHQLDPVDGAAHFHVPESRGREIVRGMRARLPGFAVPTYAKEIAGAPSKIEIG